MLFGRAGENREGQAMTATGQGKWWVEVHNFYITEPIIYSESFDSFEEAVEFACRQRRLAYFKVVLIKGPNGESTDGAEILEWCAALQSKK